MERLMVALSRMNSINAPGEVFAAVAINADSCNMENAKYWIQSWFDNYEDFKDNYSFAANVKKLSLRELALERMIKSSQHDVSYYARDLADWASLAGNFPRGTALVDGLQIPIEDYWKNIIIAAAKKQFFSINNKDLQEVVEHCEENIDPGTIHHHKLLLVLREAKSYLAGFLGDISGLGVKKSNPLIWNFAPDAPAAPETEENAYAANLDAIVAAAPATLPLRSQYSTMMEYLKAKIRYDAAASILSARATESAAAGEDNG
jgi:hypothetical protein